MANITGRRAPNMSQYIADLNRAPSQAPEPANDFDDLNLFATTDFFDFDMGDNLQASADFPRPQDTKANISPETTARSSWDGQSSTDFMSNDFQFPDFNALPSVLNTSDPVHALPPITPSTPYPAVDLSLGPLAPASATSAKRKMTESKAGFEEKTRFAAEEDKRRRNTAASARFRVKKKQREQALEKTSKEMQDRASALEKRVQELEMENRWLKGLITEKNGGKSVSELWAKFIADGGEKSLNRAAADFLKI